MDAGAGGRELRDRVALTSPVARPSGGQPLLEMSAGKRHFKAASGGQLRGKKALGIARTGPLVMLTLAFSSGGAYAHVELMQRSAAAGSDFRAVFAIDHGCAGQPTTAIRIRLDERIVAARAMEKAGWTVQTTTVTVKGKDGSATQVPREIVWSGGRIPGFFLDQFQMVVTLPAAAAGTVIYFPVVQECGGTVVRWIETPLPGENPESLDLPAPFVTLINGKSSAPNAP